MPQPELTGNALEIVRPDVVQFHGSETPEWLQLVRKYHDVEIWKALGVKDAETLATSRRYVGAADRLLFDAPAQALPAGRARVSIGRCWRNSITSCLGGLRAD